MDTYIFIVTFNFICYIGGQEELLCSHEALHVALLNPTVYSQITGNSYNYLSFAHDINTHGRMSAAKKAV